MVTDSAASPPNSVPFDGYWGKQLTEDSPDITWLWQGFLAAGNVTLLTSQWKSGKTTLLSILLARLKTGGRLAELSVRPATAVVVSEEPRAHWRRRHERLDLGHVYFITLPFRGKPTLDQWLALLDHVADFQKREGASLLAIDTLTTFLPGRNEAIAATMMEALLPLRRLTERGMSVLLVHHPAKGMPLPGQAPRGSGALASFSDINLEMSWYHKNDTCDRRRRILSHSRYQETPRQLVLELSADAGDYLVHGDFDSDEFTQNWQRLRLVLQDAHGKKTRQQLRADWPPDFPCPSDMTLYRWLLRATAAGLVCQEGTGRRSDPFRYYLPDREQQWNKDPMYLLNQKIEESQRQVQQFLDNA